MRTRFHLWIVLALLAFVLPALQVHADGARDDVARIVRLMGYGAGIHNFKNYVLRQRSEYSASARDNFNQTLKIVKALEGSAQLNANDQQALAAVKAVVESYNTALDRISDLRQKGWRIEDIDRTVIIDDKPAKAGLDVLRAKWTWSDFEEMEFQLGYGQAIHNFKNYVLRGQERYHTWALENLLVVDALVGRQLSLPELGDPRIAAETAVDRQGKINRRDQVAYKAAVDKMETRFVQDRVALVAVERVMQAYRNNLALINKLIAMQRPAQQIDLAIKIYDKPGKDGLAHLRQAGAYLYRPPTRQFED